MRNWKQLAAGLDLNIPAEDLDKLTGTMDAMEAAFRPLVSGIPHETEPAVIFHLSEELT